MCPEVKGNIVGERCREMVTISVLGGGRSGEETGFYGCEEFSVTKPFLLFSETTGGDVKAFLQGAGLAAEQAAAWSPCDESKPRPSFQHESGQAETWKCVSHLLANASAARLTPVLASHLELVKTHMFLEKALVLAGTIHWKRCFWRLPLSSIYNPNLLAWGLSSTDNAWIQTKNHQVST